jgi:hypothetical protein
VSDNPYQSPEPEVEKRPEKPPRRCEMAGLWASIVGVLTFVEFMVLEILVGAVASYLCVWPPFHTLWWHMAVVACALGLIMGCWTLRSPDSELPGKVVLLLALLIPLVFFAEVILSILLY